MKKSFRTKISASVVAVATTFSLFPIVATSASAEDTPGTAATAQTVQVDGKTSETAAASCWEIKQNDPSSASGTYWLYTPQMSAPQQFYCDQDTDGGGWVLVGRGREGWTEKSTGLGSADTIALNPDGTDAFILQRSSLPIPSQHCSTANP